MKGNLTVATTQRAESIANVIPNHQSNKPRESDIHQQSNKVAKKLSDKETECQSNKVTNHLIFITNYQSPRVSC